MSEYKTIQEKQRFYKSVLWRKLRQEVLKRDNYECQQCKDFGFFKFGQNVHHLKEIEYYPELAMEVDNLQTLCINCHNREHGRSMYQIRKRVEPRWPDEKW